MKKMIILSLAIAMYASADAQDTLSKYYRDDAYVFDGEGKIL